MVSNLQRMTSFVMNVLKLNLKRQLSTSLKDFEVFEFFKFLKKCYWLLQEAKYFKAWGFWRKNNKKTKKNYYMSAALAS